MEKDKMNKSQFALDYFRKIRGLSQKINIGDLTEVMMLIEETYRKGKTLFIAGNGGSAATASHMICDLQKTILGKKAGNKKRFRVINLGDNTPLLTAIANDDDYSKIFSESLKNLAKKGDLLLVISASGNSENIIQVIKTARLMGVKSVAFLGFDGGKVLRLVDKAVVVPANEFGLVEDFHLIFGHILIENFRIII